MKKYKIGYTTGTFDMFHIGHLNIIKRAKEQCDILIVGVSTDELVQSYKNKMPIIPFEDRALIVEAIKYVDIVVPQVHRDKIKAMHEINFDAMFVGDDWKGSELFTTTEKYFKRYGKEMVYLPHTDNISSTILAERLSKEEW